MPHQCGPIADQHVAARRACIKRVARHRQHIAPQIRRIPRRNQAARFCRRLHHHHRPRQPRHNPVAQRKMPRLRLQPRRLFRNHAALRCNLRRQPCIFRRVNHIHPARHHRHRARRQCRLMRCRINPACKARYHHLPRPAQNLCQPPRHPQPQAGRVSCPHHRHHRPRQQPDIAHRPQHRRCIRHVHQCRWITRLPMHQQPRPRRCPRPHFRLHNAQGANLITLHPRSRRNTRQNRQRRRRRPVFCHQTVKGRRPYPARANETKGI